MSDRFLTRQEAAKLLSISPATLAAWQYRAAKRGRPDISPPSVKVGKLRRYSEADLLAWVARQARQARSNMTRSQRGGDAR
jgi:predicted DNA-binding transcriptional regulator AlpA